MPCIRCDILYRRNRLLRTFLCELASPCRTLRSSSGAELCAGANISLFTPGGKDIESSEVQSRYENRHGKRLWEKDAAIKKAPLRALPMYSGRNHQRTSTSTKWIIDSVAEDINAVNILYNSQIIWSWSSRKHDKTPIGGLVGTAVYQTAEWQPLLPWLILGQGTQVGKSAVKGAGIYSIMNLSPNYWSWLR